MQSLLVCFAFGTEPQSMNIATDPPGRIPVHGFRFAASPPFQLIEEDERKDLLVMSRVPAKVREGGRPVLWR
jgi:hypothetical protein